jgi:hypothetical protein
MVTSLRFPSQTVCPHYYSLLVQTLRVFLGLKDEIPKYFAAFLFYFNVLILNLIGVNNFKSFPGNPD